MIRNLTLLALFLVSCVDPWDGVKAADTIEGYRTFIEENPTSVNRFQATSRMAELTLEAARASKSVEAYDAFFKDYPDSKLAKEASEERQVVLWNWADATDTAEAWQRFLDEYPSGQKRLKVQASQRLHMVQNASAVTVGPVTLEQVNLAENPDGPLDGWAFHADVVNNSEQHVASLTLRLRLLGEDGTALTTQDWPAVAPRLPGNMPVEEAFKVPMKPGEKRTWSWSTADLPVGWAKQSSIVPVDIRFVEEAASK